MTLDQAFAEVDAEGVSILMELDRIDGELTTIEQLYGGSPDIAAARRRIQTTRTSLLGTLSARLPAWFSN
jgi:hypothetical protein